VYGVFYNTNSLDNPTRLGKLTVSDPALQRDQSSTSDDTTLPDMTWIDFLGNTTGETTKPDRFIQLIGVIPGPNNSTNFNQAYRISPKYFSM
jgi:hypothetical protein